VVGTNRWATADVADSDDVMDWNIDRLREIQIEERLPVYFIPSLPGEKGVLRLRRAP
jgi:hypothetical protein